MATVEAYEFETAAKLVRAAPAGFDAQQRLVLYGLYKQAVFGDAPANPPGVQAIVGRTRHSAWARRRGMSKAEAMRLYVQTVEESTSLHKSPRPGRLSAQTIVTRLDGLGLLPNAKDGGELRERLLEHDALLRQRITELELEVAELRSTRPGKRP